MNLPQRIAAIDITRALTMLLMIFVNDLWTLHDIPQWLEHTEANEDGMGLADTVFPAFLFIVGMSIPYAIGNRIKKGDTTWPLIRHVLERSIALLVMGLFFVNGEYLNPAATGISRSAWNIFCCISFIFIWNQYSPAFPRTARYLIKGTGIAALVLMAIFCRSGKADHLHYFSTYWWGILGLIGWAYLASALVYVLGKGRLTVCIIAWIVFNGCSMGAHAGLIPDGNIIRVLLDPMEDGAMPGLVLGGVITSRIFRHYTAAGKPASVFVVLGSLAVMLLAAGFLTRPIWEISKIRATPSWVLICSAITIGLFLFTYWLADLRQKAGWFKLIGPAGSDTLLCYLLPYFAYGLLGSLITRISPGGDIGLVKSLLFSILMIQAAGWVSKAGIRLKL